MSICNDKHHDNPSSSRQIFVHVRESETPMRDVRNLLLEILTQYNEADKIGTSLGVLEKPTSFTDAVSWCAILGKMDHHKDSLDNASKQHLKFSVDHLEELIKGFNESVIMKIQHYRDKWMKQVLIWDALVFVTLLVLTGVAINISGGASMEAVTGFFQQRPLFSTLVILTGVGGLVGLHYVIRRMVLNRMLDKMDDTLLPGMSMARALRRNARLQHSIFRPDPVGWNFSQRKRLNAISEQLTSLRKQLEEVLANYSDQKAA